MKAWMSFAICASFMSLASAAEETETAPLTALSIEELMNIQVTSVTKKPQKLSESAAAVFVITAEDIRRSGTNTLPELLRMVPGLDVARFDANQWAISSRGFNDLYANKLLVLIDGRTLYSPLFSGVFWYAQDYPLEDIERIEVIRGPGGTLWGANAVNGVINIITRRAQDTQGWLAVVGGGNLEHHGETLRYGGRLDDSLYYRAFGKHFDRTGFVDASGDTTDDEWRQRRAGFRLDRALQDEGVLTVDGMAFKGTIGQTTITPALSPPYTNFADENTDVDGGHLRLDWQRPMVGGAVFSLQSYYDHTLLQGQLLSEERDTFDLEFKHQVPWGGRHELVSGMSYRTTSDQTEPSQFVSFTPASKTLRVYSVYVQDESLWRDERLHFIVGSKFEHNDYTGMEIQPNVRLLWKTGESGSVWAAVSRAVHTPSRGETNVNIGVLAMPSGVPVPPVAVVMNTGNPDLESERLTAFELGWRDKLHRDVSVDTALFYNKYRNFITYETGAPYPDDPLLPSYLIVPLVADNKAHGNVYGAEAELTWRAAERWRVSGSVTLLRMKLEADADSTDVSVSRIGENNPRRQWQLHSYLDLSGNVNLDAALYHVGSLPGQDVPAYTRVDLRLGWKPSENVELSLAAQNLTDKHHPEFADYPVQMSSEVPRSLYGKATLRF